MNLLNIFFHALVMLLVNTPKYIYCLITRNIFIPITTLTFVAPTFPATTIVIPATVITIPATEASITPNDTIISSIEPTL